MSTKSTLGICQLLEEVEDELLGEINSKDMVGSGEATADELFVSGIRPANKHIEAYKAFRAQIQMVPHPE